MPTGTKGRVPIQIVPVSAEDIRNDELGNLPNEWARLTRDEFRKEPWFENYDVLRLVVGLGIDISRLNAEARVAQTQDGYHVGHIMGYEVRARPRLPRVRSLGEISGDTTLDSLFDRGRMAYIDSIVVREGFQGFGVGRRLLEEYISTMRTQYGIHRFILRTHLRARRARRLFTSMGFEDLGIYDKEYEERTYWLLEFQ